MSEHSPRVSVRTLRLAALLVATGCGGDLPSASSLGVTGVELDVPRCLATAPDAFTVDTVATGLEAPWDVTFLRDGRALVTERPGRIRAIAPDGSMAESPWAVIDVSQGAETGLFGIDHIVTEAGERRVFVAGTVEDRGGSSAARAARAVGRRVTRLFNPERGHSRTLTVWTVGEVDGRVGQPVPTVEGLPTGPIHAGGALRVGPDDLIYVSSGDAAAPASAQRASSTRGKILRYRFNWTPDASMTALPSFATGTRNVQGLDWHDATGQMLAIDHGPSGLAGEGFKTDLDELNVVPEGGNLGWPIVTGATTGGDLVSPIFVWNTAIAPGGLEILGEGESAWRGDAFVTGLRGNVLERFELVTDGSAIRAECRESLLAGELGRLRLVRQAPDGTLWVGTSNRDQRGRPRPEDDVIVRIHPPAPEPEGLE